MGRGRVGPPGRASCPVLARPWPRPREPNQRARGADRARVGAGPGVASPGRAGHPARALPAACTGKTRQVGIWHFESGGGFGLFFSFKRFYKAKIRSSTRAPAERLRPRPQRLYNSRERRAAQEGAPRGWASHCPPRVAARGCTGPCLAPAPKFPAAQSRAPLPHKPEIPTGWQLSRAARSGHGQSRGSPVPGTSLSARHRAGGGSGLSMHVVTEGRSRASGELRLDNGKITASTVLLLSQESRMNET